MRIENLLKAGKILRNCMLIALFLGYYSMEVHAQTKIIHGTITSSDDGSTIPGVTVRVKGIKTRVKGIKTATFSGNKGKYVIQARIGDTLHFSFIAMEPKNVIVNGQVLNVVLKPKIVGLQEVVVDIGYGRIKKKELTGAVSHLDADEIDKFVTSDLGSAIQGQIPGVNVITSSGAPGASSEILIRGVTSVGGSNSPLFVVDGIPQEGNPDISPSEIASIDVLRDAASTAIYGSRGSAGVILITTKQGKPGTLRISVNGSSGIQHITSTAVPLMDAVQQAFFDLTEIKNMSTLNLPDDQISLGFEVQPDKLTNNTNLSKSIILNDRPVHNYNIDISGGTKELTYSVTAGYYKKEGIILHSDFNRFNMRANTRYLHDKWDISASIGLTNENTASTSNNIVTQIIKYSPLLPPIPANLNDSIFTPANGSDQNNLTGALESLNNKLYLNSNKALANINISYELFKNFKISSRLGLGTTNDYSHFFNPFQPVVNGYGVDVTPSQSSGVTMFADRRTSTSWDGLINYKLSLKNQQVFTFTGVITYENYFFDKFTASGSGVLNNSIETLGGTSTIPSVGSGPNYSTDLFGSIFRFQYDYKGKYHLSSSVRRDGSSKFSKENRWGIFPSVAAAWNTSDEPFWKPLKRVINDFKLRATYGTVGNQSFGNYAYDASITSGYDYAYGSGSYSTGGIQTDYANAGVKWETSIQTDIGADIGLFRNKLTFSIDYYDKTNKDMLFPLTLPGSTGGNLVTLNVGNMTNKGVELGGAYRMIVKGVRVNLRGTFSINKNRITKINGLGGFLYTNDYGLVSGAKQQSQITVLAEGYPAGAFFLYTTNGIVDTHEKLAAYQKIDPSARMGDLIYKDTNGDGVITDADRVYSGSGTPKYEIGFNMNASYKGFDISMYWYAALGQKIMNGAKATAFAYGRARDLVYAWSKENPVTPIPRYVGDIKSDDNYKGYTDLWLEEGSYLRLKQITLGYTLPKKTTSKLGESSMRFFISAQNPLTITNYSGYDPEIGGGLAARGLDKGNYPTTALYLIGFNFNF